MKLGLFALYKFVSEYAERIYAYVHGEDAKRHKKMMISQVIMVQHEIFCTPLLSLHDWLDQAKKTNSRHYPF